MGKISKVKLKYSLFLHRIEDWIVHSIKTENSIIYDIITNYINDIRGQKSRLEYKVKFYDPLTDYRIMDTSVSKFKLTQPTEETESQDYFSYGQLYLVLTDLRNLVMDMIFVYPFDK